MQLSRVVIAAVFFVIGALIVIPMLTGSSSSSGAASQTASPSMSVSPSVSASASASPGRRSGAPHSPTPARTPSRPTPTRTTHRPTTPPAQPAAPLAVTFDSVRCPSRTVVVSVTNRDSRTEEYAITTDGTLSVADRLPAGATRRSTVKVREDHDTSIAVTWHNAPVKTVDRTTNCVHGKPRRTLPHTGPDSALIAARIATGIAAMVTGIIIFWYGRLWPRRGGKMFDKT